MPKDNGIKLLYCSFCNRPNDKVPKMVQGNGVNICSECVQISNEYLGNRIVNNEEGGPRKTTPLKQFQASPREIFKTLGMTILGQETAKRAVALSVYRHYRRMGKVSFSVSQVDRQVILLIGPTGSGKTLLARSLATIVQVPIYSCDTTTFTQAGYVGDDVEVALAGLISAANDELSEAERGVVFLDEIDKMRRSSENRSITRDVSGEGVQQALLPILGGAKVRVDMNARRKVPNSAAITTIDTSNILFICAGSFDGIEKIVFDRLKRNGLINCNLDVDSTYGKNFLRSQVIHEDLVTFGFIPEFAGRFTSIISLDCLDADMLFEILTNKSSGYFTTYQSFFGQEGVELQASEDTLRMIATQSLQKNIGARGLQVQLDDILRQAMFEIPGSKGFTMCRIKDDLSVEYISNDGSISTPKKSSVFISYARSDETWLKEIVTVLSPLSRKGTVEVWFDSKIKPSQEWRKEIDVAMFSARVAVLLVSPNFLASDFIMSNELPYFLEMADKNSVKIFWILVSSCLYEETDLPKYQAACDPKTPLDQLGTPQRNVVYTEIARNLRKCLSD